MRRQGTWVRAVATVLLLPVLGVGLFFAVIVFFLQGFPTGADGIGLWGWVPLAVIAAPAVAISWAARGLPERVRIGLCVPGFTAAAWGGYILLSFN